MSCADSDDSRESFPDPPPGAFQLAMQRRETLQPLLDACSAAVKPPDMPDAIAANFGHAMMWDGVLLTAATALADFATLLVPLDLPKGGKHSWSSIASSRAHAIFVYDADGNEGGRARLLCSGWMISVNGYDFDVGWKDFRVQDSVNPTLPTNVLVLSKHLASSLPADIRKEIHECKQYLVIIEET
jgi:hypothetical protein